MDNISSFVTAIEDWNITSPCGRNETNTTLSECLPAVPAQKTVEIFSRDPTPGAQFIHIANTVIQPIICSCGILANILVILLLLFRRFRRSVEGQEKVVHIGFLAMSISDLLFCVCALPRAFVNEHDLIFSAGSFTMFYQLYCTGLITMFVLTGTWLIVVTAGIRYIGICHPLKARYLVHARGIYSVIACVMVICILGNLPSFWIVRAELLAPGLYLMNLGPFSHVHLRGKVYMCLRAILGMFVPGLLLIYFNVQLMLALRASTRLQQTLVRRRAPSLRSRCNSSTSVIPSKKHHLTRLLVMVVVTFLVLVYPCEIMDFFSLLEIASKNKETFIIARVVANLLQISNFAFNFLLYCTMNGTFRRALVELFCLICRRRGGGAHGRLLQRSSTPSDLRLQRSLSNGTKISLMSFKLASQCSNGNEGM